MIVGEFWRFWTRREMGDDLVMMGVWRWGGCDDGRLLKGVFGRGFDDVVMAFNVGVLLVMMMAS